MNHTPDSGCVQDCTNPTPEETPQPDTIKYRVDYRWRRLAYGIAVHFDMDVAPNTDQIRMMPGIVPAESWHKSSVVIECDSVLNLAKTASKQIEAEHKNLWIEYQIRKVIRLDAQRGESEAAK